jgi:hypothetical protein
MAQYIEATEMEDESARQKVLQEILKYNEEDLAATWAVLCWLKEFGPSGAAAGKQRLRHYVVLPRYPPVQRPHHQIPGIHAVRRFAPGAKILCGIELWLDGGDDGLGDLVLHCEHVPPSFGVNV